ncbi:WSC domain-containing protein [Phlyctema vagabunda]|uniref:WSC domain-containing protein n=1 Tax=Phlyctema vagabunda TaxID=108571 RepID=A0ABR4PL92_9HELO
MNLYGIKFAFRALFLLSLVNLISARSYPVKRALLAVPKTLPGSWSSLGCYTDIGRTLAGGAYNDKIAMTTESCINYCTLKGYLYAGTESSEQCFCGMKIASASLKAPITDCNSACSGNTTQSCGGLNRLNMFWSGTIGPQINLGNDSWAFSGCYAEGKSGHTLPVSVATVGGTINMTVGLCASACRKQGYKLAGTENGGQCWCGDTISNGGFLAPEGLTGCNTLCYGNFSEYCGGNGRLNVYNYENAVNLPIYYAINAAIISDTKTSTTSRLTSSTSSASRMTTTTSRSSSTSLTLSSRLSSSTSTPKSLTTSRFSSITSGRSSTSTRASVSTTPKSSSSSSRSNTAKLSSSSTGTSRSSTSTSQLTSSPKLSSTSISPSNPSTSTSTRLPSSSTTVSKLVVSSSTTKSSSTSSTRIYSSLSSRLTSSSIISSRVSSSISASPTSSRSSSSSRTSTSYTTTAKGASGITSITSSTSTAFGTKSSSSLSTSNTRTSTSTAVSQSSSSTSISSQSFSVQSTSTTSEFLTTSDNSGSSMSTTSSNTASFSSTEASDTTTMPSSTSSTSTSSVRPIKTAPAIEPYIGDYAYMGCYKETNNGRALSGATFAYDTMTLESCQASCGDSTYFGVEYGRECYCGNTISKLSIRMPASDCSFYCPGDQFEYCGAGDRLSVYQLKATVTNDTSATTSAADASATTSGVSSPTAFPANWTSQGCWVDGVNGRILNNQLPDSETLTLETCVNSCAALGYTIAGAEYEVQCFCDNYVYNGGALAANSGDCNAPCRGNSQEYCGGGGRLSMYSIGTPKVFKAPSARTSDLPENWKYSGCLEDNIASVENPNEILNTFPYKFESENNMTVAICISKCEEYGYDAAGLEYGIQCFCGDVQNIQVASVPSPGGGYTRSRVPQVVPDAQCNVPCSGDREYLCGAGNRLSWYSYNSTKPLYSWDFPEDSAAGRYDLLIGGVTVPLITAEMITGKVTFVEKAGTGAPNGTGAYELDLSQIDNFDAAWRTMNGFQTDVFCAAGLILPDRGGRQLTIGGWAGVSNYGIRLYLPDGSAGVKGKNQWMEDPQNLQLQVPRWYPSALIMANGSILVIGGEIAQNDLPQPTLEILPPTGVKTTDTKNGYSNTTVYLEFLERTHPFNLYPFVAVVNSGIFIAYHNEARILDDKTFQTIKVLPNIPGAVHRSDGGRSYQLEGTMMTLPQYAPFTEPLGVLICGGSTPAGGEALDNCVSTYPEAADPTWTIERMPSRRVLPCMAALPDGTYLILNGAEHGVAGFGLAYDPNFSALLYDPTKPLHSRISVMANTTVARLYHSEATVLLDGRVMVSGSDPQNDPNDEFFWPEEYRVEAFSPPYLLSGNPRPVLAITNKDWAYGEAVSFTISVATADIKVSLLGSVVSTHGNSMGQRTLFPAVSCSGNTCTVTAPPNAHACPPGWYQMFVLSGPTPSVGVYVRVGGDPAGLGDWPNLPKFDLPGTGPV